MMKMTLRQVMASVDGHAAPGAAMDEGTEVTSAVTDSRLAQPGSLFVAIAGEHVDGHDYVDAAAHNGAVAALVQHAVPDAGIAQIIVEDGVAALGELAKANLRMRRNEATPFTIIGITGSVGKTTTKDLLKALLSTLGETVAPVGSFNNEIGLPLTALEVDEHTRYLVAEMGANHLGEIAHLTTIAPPDIAIVLKVGVAHLGEFGSVEHIAQAKSEIVRGLLNDGVTVLNADDARVTRMQDIAPGKVVWFGIEHAQVHERDGYVAADGISLDDLGHPVFTLVTACETRHHRTAQYHERPRSRERGALGGHAARAHRRRAQLGACDQRAPHGSERGAGRRCAVHAHRRFVQREPRFDARRHRRHDGMARRRRRAAHPRGRARRHARTRR